MRNKRLVSSALIVLFLVAVCIVGGGCKKSETTPENITKTEVSKEKEPPQSEAFKKANGLFEEKKYKEALPIIEDAIKKDNDPWCMNLAGILYNNGWGVKKDLTKGLDLMQKAADQNVSPALNNLGTIHLAGLWGVPQNTEKGLSMLNKAIELNNSNPAVFLGYCYEAGEYVEQDFNKALEYFKTAQKLGKKGLENKIYNLEHLPNIIADSPEYIVRDYEQNEVAADNKYKGKTIRISGRINDIGKDIMDQIYITFKMPGQWEIRTVQCFFSDAHSQEIGNLRKGQDITIQGTVNGLMMNVLLKDCWIVKE